MQGFKRGDQDATIVEIEEVKSTFAVNRKRKVDIAIEGLNEVPVRIEAAVVLVSVLNLVHPTFAPRPAIGAVGRQKGGPKVRGFVLAFKRLHRRPSRNPATVMVTGNDDYAASVTVQEAVRQGRKEFVSVLVLPPNLSAVVSACGGAVNQVAADNNCLRTSDLRGLGYVAVAVSE